MADVWDALFWAIVAAGWPGLLGVSAFAIYRSVRFYHSVRRSAPGLLVLLTVTGWVTTLAGAALVSTFYLVQSPEQAGPVVLPVFLLWAGSMVVIVWVVQRWGHEAVALDAYYGELEQMERMKTRFINHVAHELNTPIMPLQVQAHLLREGRLGELSEKQGRAVGVIARNLDRLQYLVEMVVLSSQIQAERVEVRSKDVPLRELLPTEGVQAEVDDVVVQADPKHGRFITDQITAWTERNGGGPVQVEAYPSGNRWRVRFRCVGVEDARMFEPFREPADLDRTEQYVGLEMFVAQGLARANGGDLEGHAESGATVLQWTVPRPS